MSVAGVDPTATAGISGVATSVNQLEQAAEIREPSVQQRKELDYTNVSMSLDVASKQYIYTGTYTWSTNDVPGKVIALFPIHPDACNAYTAHLYQMFNAWVGGMKVRVRIIGTAFYGGGLYFVRIPPNFSDEQIRNEGLGGLTAFPHSDLDPKNLNSIDMDLEDYRTQHFHSGDLLLSDPNSFAGWLAIVVNARLVTQSADISSLDLRVDMAGNFDFRVPRPIRSLPTEATGPLSQSSLDVSTLVGTDDAACVMGSTRLIVCPSTEKRFTNGNVFMRRAGGTFTYQIGVNANFYEPTHAISGTWLEIITRAREHLNAGQWFATGTYPWVLDANSHENKRVWAWIDDLLPGASQKAYWKAINFRWGSNHGTPVDFHWQTTEEEEYGHLNGFNYFPELSGPSSRPYMYAYSSLVPNHNGVICLDDTHYGLDIRASIDYLSPFVVPSLDDPAIGAESYILLNTNNGNSCSAQARQWAEDLARFKSWPAGSAAKYAVINKTNNNVMAYIKMRENGHFYAPASSSILVIGTDCTLKFEQWIPENEPLVVPPALAAEYTSAAIRDGSERAIAKLTAKLMKQAALKASAPQGSAK